MLCDDFPDVSLEFELESFLRLLPELEVDDLPELLNGERASAIREPEVELGLCGKSNTANGDVDAVGGETL